jgi:tRNA 5-methylaminomethyl-2-thiouridine biosynthesis bifunctional protein
MYQAVETILTTDNSLTLYDPELKVTYRSRFGAHRESEYVFIQGCQLLERSDTSNTKILELGFGAATNFFSATNYHLKKLINSPVHQLEYMSIDHRPLHPAVIPDKEHPLYSLVCTCLTGLETNSIFSVNDPERQIRLTLIKHSWDHPVVNTIANEFQADYYFHDPFGPNVNPECWSHEVFVWAYNNLKPGGRMATYGAASITKRNIRKAGFQLQVRPGLPPKREVLTASKPLITSSYSK